jgi:hypothetical protein
MSEKQMQEVVIPPDVRAFAAEQKVEEHLPAVVEAARRAFPQAEVRLFVEDDYEIEGVRYIVVLVAGLRMGVEEAFAARQEYYRGLFASMPAPFVIHFRFDLEFA